MHRRNEEGVECAECLTDCPAVGLEKFKHAVLACAHCVCYASKLPTLAQSVGLVHAEVSRENMRLGHRFSFHNIEVNWFVVQR